MFHISLLSHLGNLPEGTILSDLIIILKVEVHAIPIVHPGSKNKLAHLGIKWPVGQIQITIHLKLTGRHPGDLSVTGSHMVHFSKGRHIITTRTVERRQIWLPYFLGCQIDLLNVAILFGIPLKSGIKPFHGHPTVNTELGRDVVQVYILESHAQIDQSDSLVMFWSHVSVIVLQKIMFQFFRPGGVLRSSQEVAVGVLFHLTGCG
uniref:Uncharacterized protein n=1 Tax=Cacopsylla melanoneura TaxID=428564 RepID=A0A8D8LGK1_9HEMI